MALKKTTFFFVDGRNNGWSNSLYYDGSSVLGTPTLALQLVAAWVKMLGTGVKCTYIRESLDSIKGDGFLYEVPATADYAGAAGKPTEQAGSCVLLYMGNLAWTKKKAIYQHAVWDTRITGGALALPAGYAALQTNFFDLLKQGWGWKTVTGNRTAAMLTAEPTTGNKLLLTTAADIFLPPFDGRNVQVRVSGLPTIPPVRNPLVVKPLTARTCVTKGRFFLPDYVAPTPLPVAGQMVANTYAFFPAERATAERACQHKVGRPFRPQAGGRSKR